MGAEGSVDRGGRFLANAGRVHEEAPKGDHPLLKFPNHQHPPSARNPFGRTFTGPPAPRTSSPRRPKTVWQGRNPEETVVHAVRMSALENPSENPCFGCGPLHPRGLHLKFEEATSPDGVPEVRTSFVPQPDEIGWPTLFHHGLHFLVLYEASYWTALTLGRKLWVSQGAISYNALRLPRVGIAHVARGRIVTMTPTRLEIRAETETKSGKPCGVLGSTWVPARRDVVERAGIPLPDYLRSELSS